MALFKLWHESVSYGHEVYDGPGCAPGPSGPRDFKLAVVTTSTHVGLVLNGVGIPKPLPKVAWRIRLTSPEMNVDDMRALVEYVATIPEDPSPMP